MMELKTEMCSSVSTELKLDLRGSHSETLNVPFEDGEDPVVRDKPLSAPSSGVLTEGKAIRAVVKDYKGHIEARGVTKGGHWAAAACVGLQYNGKIYECVLDTGAECSMLPADMLIGEMINATEDKLYAINGQQLEVIGKTDVLLEAPGLTLLTSALVVDGIEKPTLGLEWLRCHRATWNFGADTVIIGGVEIPLMAGGIRSTPDATETSEGQGANR